MSSDELLSRFGLEPRSTKTTRRHIGKAFTRLTILAIGRPYGSYRYTAVCLCACGNGPFTVRLDKVTGGLTQSCGCFHKHVITKHGQHSNPVHRAWRSMVRRCTNPKDSSYERYGGRGITVCERWLNFDNFTADMGSAYKPGLQLERVDNAVGYSPENCRWISGTEQQRNKRNNIRITINGQTKVLAEWCVVYGVPYRRAWERITAYGWEPERALSAPARK